MYILYYSTVLYHLFEYCIAMDEIYSFCYCCLIDHHYEFCCKVSQRWEISTGKKKKKKREETLLGPYLVAPGTPLGGSLPSLKIIALMVSELSHRCSPTGAHSISLSVSHDAVFIIVILSLMTTPSVVTTHTITNSIMSSNPLVPTHLTLSGTKDKGEKESGCKKQRENCLLSFLNGSCYSHEASVVVALVKLTSIFEALLSCNVWSLALRVVPPGTLPIHQGSTTLVEGEDYFSTVISCHLLIPEGCWGHVLGCSVIIERRERSLIIRLQQDCYLQIWTWDSQLQVLPVQLTCSGLSSFGLLVPS